MDSRYLRQTILPGFGTEGQEALRKAKVLIVGAGGLGVPVLTYLNAMGVGTLGIVDADIVSESNLHRQVLFTEAMVGKKKVEVAKDQLQAQNSATTILVYKTFLEPSNASEIIRKYDLVVDATDNFPTRYLINDVCVIQNKPFVYGALHGFEGQVSVFNYKNGPTYRCLFPKMPKMDEVPNCNEHGVLGILPGIIGNLQALEVIKIVSGLDGVLSGILLLYDGISQRMQRMKFNINQENLKISQVLDSYEFECEVPNESIQAVEIQNLLKDKNIELIDVRTPQEFQSKNLVGAKNIPLDELEERVREVKQETPVYVICQSGTRSLKAIITLQKLFPNNRFINVTGGMNQIDTYANTY
ncbi:HesA/MoeB/ThiF family protein [Maribacter sp. PR1]|uniref:HesA/MoeB/ThiF family protein n=1 Tax=Maribacter cobaltidurans TaxID=1178778 RepID=A0ABU7IWS2_9FLAO|nr:MULTISPECIES: HesA/MoeB/ThiF family protein [Maribacter]MDC6389856.1 HesA/MoeB/ThiF family protein [Maribacter sp. PR1]MEE1977246.1 HesA/MoeB/ThiF family protein [Maribacter cobaltidurans]